MEPNPPAAALYVATDLDSFEVAADAPYAEDVTVSGRAYRRLDPPYYAWLRRQMAGAKRALDAKRITAAAFDVIRAPFNAIHAWALRAFGEAALVAAAKATDATKYQPPRPDDDLPLCGARLTPRSPTRPSGHAFPSGGDFAFAEPVAPDAVAKVDAVRAEALALGWTEAGLYRNRSHLRFPYGREYGLVCFLDGDAAVGEVRPTSIEIVRPRGARTRFANPDAVAVSLAASGVA
ncbi:MAG: hypothetical protein K8T90_07885 [Planctomycetes bacterium]|nr:hypothetical protein [Planctomycetota bacterium]